MDDLEQAVCVIPNLGFWAAYDNVPLVRRILIEPCTEKFIEKLRDLHAQGQILSQVCIATAPKQYLLLDPEWEERVQTAVAIIKTAKVKGDKKSLERFRSARESDGLKRGPKVTAESNRWKIKTLHALAKGGLLKQSIPHPTRTSNSASAELSRYCRDFYGVCRLLGMETREAWQRGAKGVWFKEQFERFGFSFPKDFAAAEEAYRRGGRWLTTA
jgi:hypothetical protein